MAITYFGRIGIYVYDTEFRSSSKLFIQYGGGSIGVLENIGVIILEPRVQVTDMKQQIALIAIDLFAVYMIFTDFMNL